MNKILIIFFLNLSITELSFAKDKKHSSKENDLLLNQIGVEKVKIQNYIAKIGCALAVGTELGTTTDGNNIWFSDVNCIKDVVVNQGGVNESKGCTFVLLKSKEGMYYGLGQYRENFPQVKESCDNGGVQKLFKKKWGSMTVGEWFISGSREIGVNPKLIYSSSVENKNIYDVQKKIPPAPWK